MSNKVAPLLRRCLPVVVAAAALAAGGVRAADCRAQELPAFDAAGAWVHGPLSKLKRDTTYAVEREEGQAVLHATADGSASAWVLLKALDLAAAPMLEWRWRVPALIKT